MTDKLSRRGTANFDAVCLIIVIGGIALRLRQFLFNRNLWLDEGYVTSSFLTRSISEILRYPLDYNQPIPVGFMLCSKLLFDWFGESEYVLRLVSLVSGIACLLLLWVLLARIFGPLARRTGLYYAAVCPTLVYYSAEVKQYSTEALVTALLLILHLRVLQRVNHRRDLLYLGVAGTIAIFFSFSAVFVMAAIGSLHFIQNLKLRRYRDAGMHAAVSAFWLAAFAFNYAYFLKPLRGFKMRDNFWSDNGGFPPADLISAAGANWIYWIQFKALINPFGLDFPGLGLFLICLGLIFCAPKHLPLVQTLLGIVAFAILAAIIRVYPFGLRVLIYLIPVYLILLAFGISQLVEFFPQRRLAAAAVLLVILFFNPSFASLKRFVNPAGDEEIAEVLEIVASQAKAGDVLVISEYSVPTFHYYRRRIRLDHLALEFSESEPRFTAVVPPSATEEVLIDPKTVDPSKSIWLVFSQSKVRSGVSIEEQPLLQRWASNGRTVRERFFRHGAWLYWIAPAELSNPAT